MNNLIKNLNKIKKVATRDGCGKALVKLGSNKNIVVLCGDVTESTRMHWFMEKYPERFFEVGVAEQNMMGIAAGLALSGKIPYAASYAVFNPGRNWEQLRVSVAYSKANVKIIGGHAGISVGPDGATHQALEDIALTRVLPNIVVIVPVDAIEAEKATIQAAKIKGPVYLRFTRNEVPVITNDKTPFKIGKAEIFRDGKDLTIIACGSLVYEALVAAEKLKKNKISVQVINNHTIKPLDKKTILKSAKQTNAIITAEEHQVHGGLGSCISEFLSQNYPVPMKIIGVQDRFGESGKPDELLKKYGLTSINIVKEAKILLKRK